MSKCVMLVCDAPSVSIDLSQAQVEKKKKKQVASPGEGWKRFTFPTKQGEKGKKQFWDSGPSWGSADNTIFIFFFQLENPA